MGTVFFVLTNVLAAAAAWRLARLLTGAEPGGRRFLIATLAFPTIVSFILMGLGWFGLLTPGVVLLSLLGVATFLGLLLRRATPGGQLESRAADWSFGTQFPRRAWIAIALVGGFGGVLLVKACVVGLQFTDDDLSYHGPAVATWLQHAKLLPAPRDYHAYYAKGAELVSMWFVLPFHTDALASAGGLIWIGLAATAMAILAKRIGADGPAALMMVGLFVASPVVVGAAVRYAAVDVAPAALMLSAIAFAVPHGQTASRRRTVVDAACCGVGAGLSIGCKVSYLPLAIVLGAWWLICPGTIRWRGRRFVCLFVFAAGAVLTGGYWYVRNWLMTGNPLFPAAVGPFDGPFGPVEQAQTRLFSWILRAPLEGELWSTILWGWLRWPFALGLAALLGYVRGAWRFFAGRRRPGESPAANGLLLATGFALALSHFAAPFSATDNAPDAPLRIATRFLIGPYAIGLVLLTPLLRGHQRATAFLWVLCLFAAAASLIDLHPITPVVVVTCAVASVGLVAAIRRLAWRRPIVRCGVITVCALALLMLALWAPYRRQLNDQALFAWGDSAHPVGAGWEAVNKLPPRTRIAWYGPAAYQHYPLFGRRLRMEPVRFSGEGRRRRFLHERWHDNPDTVEWWPRSRRAGDATSLVDHLTSGGVEAVFVTKWNGLHWPPQYDVLSADPRADCVYDDGYSSVWRLQQGR